MAEIIKAGIGLVLEFVVFFCLGNLLMRKLKMREETSLSLVLGYILYFSLFEIAAVPMVLSWAPLHVLSAVWAVLLAALIVFSVIAFRKQWLWQIKEMGSAVKAHGLLFFLVALVILIQCLIVVCYQDTTVDAAYYVGMVSTSLYTDTLGRYNPYTGLIYETFQARYVFSTYPMHNAVWCQILGMHPIVQAKIVMPVFNVLVSNLIIYHIGKRLFHGGRKQADLMVCFVCLMQLFTYTVYTPGFFFFTRNYEGKSILANIVFPLILYCSIWFWQRPKDKNVWIVLLLISLGGVAISGSSIILPVAVSAGILPVLAARKQAKALGFWILCMLPSLLYAGIYFAEKMGWVTFMAS